MKRSKARSLLRADLPNHLNDSVLSRSTTSTRQIQSQRRVRRQVPIDRPAGGQNKTLRVVRRKAKKDVHIAFPLFDKKRSSSITRKFGRFGPSPFGVPTSVRVLQKPRVSATSKLIPDHPNTEFRTVLKKNSTVSSTGSPLISASWPLVRRKVNIEQSPSVPKNARRKILQAQGESEAWNPTANLLQEILDTENYAAINQLAGAITMEVDQLFANGLDTPEGSAGKKLVILKTLEIAMMKAVKNEGYVCEILGVSQVLAANSQLIIPESIKVLANIVKTVTSVGSVNRLSLYCTQSAIRIFSQSLTASSQQTCGGQTPDSILTYFLNNLEESMTQLMLKTTSSLVTGQTQELTPHQTDSFTTQQVSRSTVAEQIGIKKFMTAAAGRLGLQVSYQLPANILNDVQALRQSSDLTVQFGTFHHAPRVNGVQPISPIVSLSLANDAGKISITDLTDPIEITIPIVNQAAVCGRDQTAEPVVACMYWADGEYKSHGCETQKIDATRVKCLCKHLTSFVVLPIPPPCAVGFTGEPGGCDPCPSGTYKSEEGSGVCLSCRANSDSPSVGSSICTCNAGSSTGPDGDSCEICRAGTYKEDLGDLECIECDAGKYSILMGATAINSCKPCLAGTYSSTMGAPSQASCLLCEKGRYSSIVGASSSMQCEKCVAGKYSPASGATSVETCVSCLRGKYSSVSGESSPNTCTDCAADTYSTVMASNTDANCQSCLEGKLSAAGSDAENDCKDKSGPCSKGYTGEAGDCTKCTPGTFKSTTGNSLCELCPPNSDSLEGSRTCTCNDGYVGPDGGPCESDMPQTTVPQTTDLMTTPAPPIVEQSSILVSSPAPIPGEPDIQPPGGKFVGYVEIKIVAFFGVVDLSVSTKVEELTCEGALSESPVTMVVLQNSTAKAISCADGIASVVASEIYVITPGPIVEVTFKIEGPLSAADMDDATRTTFLKSFAGVLRLSSERMSLSIGDARRRLLAVDLTISILANSLASAAEIKANVESADLSTVELPDGATIGSISVVVKDPKQKIAKDPTPETPNRSIVAIIAVAIGAFVAVSLGAAFIFFYLRRKIVREKELSAKLLLPVQPASVPPVTVLPSPSKALAVTGKEAAPKIIEESAEPNWSDLSEALNSMRFLSSDLVSAAYAVPEPIEPGIEGDALFNREKFQSNSSVSILSMDQNEVEERIMFSEVSSIPTTPGYRSSVDVRSAGRAELARMRGTEGWVPTNISTKPPSSGWGLELLLPTIAWPQDQSDAALVLPASHQPDSLTSPREISIDFPEAQPAYRPVPPSPDTVAPQSSQFGTAATVSSGHSVAKDRFKANLAKLKTFQDK